MNKVKIVLAIAFCVMVVTVVHSATAPVGPVTKSDYESELNRLQESIKEAKTVDDLNVIGLAVEAMKTHYKQFVYPASLARFRYQLTASTYQNLVIEFEEKQNHIFQAFLDDWFSDHNDCSAQDLMHQLDSLLGNYNNKPYFKTILHRQIKYKHEVYNYLNEQAARIVGLSNCFQWEQVIRSLDRLRYDLHDFHQLESLLQNIDAHFSSLKLPNFVSLIIEQDIARFRKYVDDSKKEEEARLQAEKRRVQAYNTYRSRMPELLEKVKQPAESFEQARAFLDEVKVFKTGDYYSLVTDHRGEFIPEYTSLWQGAEKHLAVFFDQKVMALKNKVDALVQGDSNFEQMIEECEQECVALQAQAPEIIDDYFNIHAKQKKHYKELRYALELKLRDVQRQVYANEMEEPIFNGREAWANEIARLVLGQSQYDEQFLRILNKALLGRSVVGRPHDAQVALIRKLRDQSSKFADYINAWLLEQKKSFGWDELIQQLVQAKKDGKNERIKFLLALLDNSINLLDYPVLIKALLVDDLAPYSEVLRHEQQQAGDTAAHKKKNIALKLSGAAAVAAGIGAGGYIFYKNRHKTPEQIAQLKWYKRYPMQLARKIEQAARFVSSGV